MTPAEFVDDNNDERIGVDGTWRQDGSGALRVTATHVFLDTLQAAFDAADALRRRPRSRRDDPRHARAPAGVRHGDRSATAASSASAIRSWPAASPTPASMFDIDLRLDQAPGVWITAVGKVPLGAVQRRQLPEQPIDVAIKSSTISLGLIEGVTERRPRRERRAPHRRQGDRHQPRSARRRRGRVANAAFLVGRRAARATRTCAPRWRWRTTSVTVDIAARRGRRRPGRSTCTAASARTSCASAISRSR